jgi:hypothetical protein
MLLWRRRAREEPEQTPSRLFVRIEVLEREQFRFERTEEQFAHRVVVAVAARYRNPSLVGM